MNLFLIGDGANSVAWIRPSKFALLISPANLQHQQNGNVLFITFYQLIRVAKVQFKNWHPN